MVFKLTQPQDSHAIAEAKRILAKRNLATNLSETEKITILQGVLRSHQRYAQEIDELEDLKRRLPHLTKKERNGLDKIFKQIE